MSLALVSTIVTDTYRLVANKNPELLHLVEDTET